MNKRFFTIILLCVLTSGLCGGLADGGTSSDPVVSLSYVTGNYIPDFEKRADAKIESALHLVYNEAFTQLAEEAGRHNAATAINDTSWRTLLGTAGFKCGDVIMGSSGLRITLLTGTAKLVNSSGALTDTVAGGAAPNGANVIAGRVYEVTGGSDSGICITSDVATVTLSGDYSLLYSSAVDYTSLADALYAMGLFRGRTDGYALSAGATRAEGLVMFLRLIGKENEALSYKGAQPFTDASWADRYIAYAYSKGYTKGVSANKFGTNDPLSADHYATFLLRTLGFTEGNDFDYKTVMSDSLTLGVLNKAEVAKLQSSFTRAQVVYLSYWSLFRTLKGQNDSILTSLISTSSVAEDSAIRAISTAKAVRIQ